MPRDVARVGIGTVSIMGEHHRPPGYSHEVTFIENGKKAMAGMQFEGVIYKLDDCDISVPCFVYRRKRWDTHA